MCDLFFLQSAVWLDVSADEQKKKMQNEQQAVCVRNSFIPAEGLDAMQILSANETYDCRICKNQLSSPVQLTIHYVTLHRLYPCKKCLLLFTTRQNLDKHRQKNHLTGHHMCSECEKVFSSNEMLDAHSVEIHAKQMCTMCTTLVPCDSVHCHMTEIHRNASISLAKIDTIYVLTDKNVTCELCGTDMKVDRFFTHYLFYHKLSLHYLFDKILFKRNTSAILKVTQSSNDGFLKNTVCIECGLMYSMLAPKIVHSIHCEGLVYCQGCMNCFSDQMQYDIHACTSNAIRLSISGQCMFCCAQTIEPIETHYAEKHKFDSSISPQLDTISELYDSNYECNFCQKDLKIIFENVNKLIEHFLVFHEFQPMNILKYLRKSNKNCSSPTSIKKSKHDRRSAINYLEVPDDISDETNAEGNDGIIDFDSNLVKLVYSSASDYDSSDSDDAEPFRRRKAMLKCPFCGFRSSMKFVLASHIQKNHGFLLKPHRFGCNVCKKVFETLRKLRQHHKNVHHKRSQSGEKRYKCAFCEYTANGKNMLRQHLSEHVEASYHPCSAKDIGFNCKYCHFVFWTLEKLEQHVLNRHSEEISETFLVCNICLATVINKASLRNHFLFRHSSERQLENFTYQCILCRTVHPCLDAIRCHMLSVHPQLQSVYCAQPNCMQNVNSSSQLQAHVINFHKKTLFKCLECFKLFKTKEFIVKHCEESHATQIKYKK